MTASLLSTAMPAYAAALIAVGCGVAVITRERFSKNGWLHFLLTSGVALWQLCVAQLLSVGSVGEAEYWARGLAATAILVPALHFHFSYSLVRGRDVRLEVAPQICTAE